MARVMIEDFLRDKKCNKFEYIVCICKRAYDIESSRISSLFANQKSTVLALEEAYNGNLDCGFKFSHSDESEHS